MNLKETIEEYKKAHPCSGETFARLAERMNPQETLLMVYFGKLTALMGELDPNEEQTELLAELVQEILHAFKTLSRVPVDPETIVQSIALLNEAFREDQINESLDREGVDR